MMQKTIIIILFFACFLVSCSLKELNGSGQQGYSTIANDVCIEWDTSMSSVMAYSSSLELVIQEDNYLRFIHKSKDIKYAYLFNDNHLCSSVVILPSELSSSYVNGFTKVGGIKTGVLYYNDAANTIAVFNDYSQQLPAGYSSVGFCPLESKVFTGQEAAHLSECQISNLSYNSAVLSGKINGEFGPGIGVIYSSDRASILSSGKRVLIDSKDFSISLKSLKSEMTYYYLFYETGVEGDVRFISTIKSFTTETAPSPDGSTDLGLSVYWADCNLGASTPEECGEYYSWGETDTKDAFYWDKYKWCGSSQKIIKYNTRSSDGAVDNLVTLKQEDDAAYALLGGKWRIPTKAEMEELLEKCTHEWITQEGVNGVRFTGPNGNSIFLPAAGNRFPETAKGIDSFGDYWTSSLYQSDCKQAYYLLISEHSAMLNQWSRWLGYSIRPVTK